MMRREEEEEGEEEEEEEEEERGSGSSSRCQDCGNQAKRDCQHSRCRSCCKSRGFQCQTHVKSTWIPVARRRPRHLTLHHHHQIPPLLHPHLRHHPPNPKTYRQIPPLGFEEESFPAEICFPAVFRCVRVSSIDNAVDEYAYQTTVSIGRHVFTGILYDQGRSERHGTGNYATGESSSSAAAALSLLEHPNIVGRSTTATATATGTTSTPFLAFPNATSQFFHHSKS